MHHHNNNQHTYAHHQAPQEIPRYSNNSTGHQSHPELPPRIVRQSTYHDEYGQNPRQIQNGNHHVGGGAYHENINHSSNNQDKKHLGRSYAPRSGSSYVSTLSPQFVAIGAHHKQQH